MTMKSILKASVAAAFSIALLAIGSQISHAQVCGGTSMTNSTLQYIVRDAKGAAIDAATKDLQLAKSDSPRGGFTVGAKDFIGKYEGKWSVNAPEAITSLVGRVSVVRSDSSPRCNFAAAQTLQLTLAGKTMRLLFLTPHLPEYQSVGFLVDSIPFQEGIFSIDLPTVPDGEPKFYEARGWKKITEAEESMIQAEASMWNHDYAKAVENWKRAATLNPGNPKIPRYLGYSLIETKQYKDGVATLQEAVRLNPKSAITHSSLAQAYWLNGQKIESVNAFSKALDLGPDDPDADRDWAIRTRDDLKRELIKIDAEGPPPTDAKDWFADGVLHFKATLYKESTARFERARQLDPQNVKNLKWLGPSYQMIDKDAEGVSALKEAVRLAPNDAEAQGLLGEAYLYSKNYKSAVDSLTEAVRLAPTVKDWQDSLKKAQDALKSPPESQPAPKQQPSVASRQFVKVDPKVLDEYVGKYQMPATEFHQAFILDVYREGDKLISEAFGHRADFLPYSDTEFYMREESVELRFVRDAQGRVDHIEWDGTIVKKIK